MKAVSSLPAPIFSSTSYMKDIQMRLTQEQWFVIASAVGFVGELAREDRAALILNQPIPHRPTSRLCKSCQSERVFMYFLRYSSA